MGTDKLPRNGGDDRDRRYARRLTLLQDAMIDYEIVVADAHRDVDRAVAQLKTAIRRRDEATRRLQDAIEEAA